MRLKYFEEHFGEYFVFGKYPDGRVGVATPDDSSVATVTREEADKLVANRRELLSAFDRAMQAFSESDPGGCRKYWREEQGR